MADLTELTHYIPDLSLPLAAIFDIDGTLSDEDGSDGFDPNLIDTYQPIKPVISIAQALYVRGYRLVILTGRPDTYKAETLQWLIRYVAPFAELLMRPEGDTRNGWEVKYDQFNKAVRQQYNVDVVFENDKQTAKMYKAMGLVCLRPVSDMS